MDKNFMQNSKKVAVIKGGDNLSYPKSSPFDPSKKFPEFEPQMVIGSELNEIYPLIRELFYSFGLDINNFDKPEWNPLGEIVKPGQRVLVKPNLVRHIHMGNGNFDAVVTHPSIIRCILDYIAKALGGSGEIIVGDAPVQSAHFPTIIAKTGLDKVCSSVSDQWGIPVSLVDFRLVAVEIDSNHRIVRSQQMKGDISGYQSVNLGRDSMLSPLNDNYEKFRVTSYDCSEMLTHHNQDCHEYLIPKTVLTADVVINIPKLKTHRKVGMTAALKNLVGINGHKDWLPHHRCGSIKEGGDEYLNASLIKKTQNFLDEIMFTHSSGLSGKLLQLSYRVLDRLGTIVWKDQFKEGSWYGNDTAWRMVLDLNRLLIYADQDGKMTSSPQRKVFTIVDAVLAGDGEGPMQPNARACGMLVCGQNPLAVDTVLANLVGFVHKKLPLLANGYQLKKWPIADFNPNEINVIIENDFFKEFKLGNAFTGICFKPSSGWEGHIEYPECKDQIKEKQKRK